MLFYIYPYHNFTKNTHFHSKSVFSTYDVFFFIRCIQYFCGIILSWIVSSIIVAVFVMKYRQRSQIQTQEVV